MIHFSIVIPVYNEEENIEPLVSEIEETMNALQKPWELIFVDDGSKDHSNEIIRALQKNRPSIRLLTFKKNAGQTAAFDAGFKAAQGRFIITLDADGQNDPQDIPKLISAIEEGYDLVTGFRKNRKDTKLKRLISKSANFVRQRVLSDGVQDTGCSLKIFRQEMVAKFSLYKGLHRFFSALVLMHGGKVKEVEVSHRPRLKGISKYSLFSRGPALFFDMLAVGWMKRRSIHYEVLK